MSDHYRRQSEAPTTPVTLPLTRTVAAHTKTSESTKWDLLSLQVREDLKTDTGQTTDRTGHRLDIETAGT